MLALVSVIYSVFCFVSVHSASTFRERLLFYGILLDNPSLCARALAMGVDPNTVTPDEFRPAVNGSLPALHLALLLGRTQCAMSVYDSGGDLYAHANENDDTRPQFYPAIMYCLKRLNPFHYDDHAKSFSEIMTSIAANTTEIGILRESISSWMKVTMFSSPLMTAVSHSDVDAAKRLISWGFDTEIIDEFGWGPLHISAWRGDSQMITLLLLLGANPFAQTPDGLTALHISAMRGFGSVADSILSSISSTDKRQVVKIVSIADKRSLTAIDIALLPPRKVRVLKALKRHGVSVTGKKPHHEPYRRNVSLYSSKHCWSREEEPAREAIEGVGALMNIASISVDDLNSTSFATEYFDLQVPLLIHGNLSANMHFWDFVNDRGLFVNRYGHMELQTGEIPYAQTYRPEGRQNRMVALKDFLKTMDTNRKSTNQTSPTSNWIAFDKHFGLLHPDLVKDMSTPPLFESICLNRGMVDLKRLYKGEQQLSIGGRSSGAPLHSHVAAFNVVFAGVKRWTLFPPGHLDKPDDIETIFNGKVYEESFRSDAGWGLGERLSREEHELAVHSQLGVEVLQFPGDVLFIPSNWGHATENLCETVSIAQEFGCLDDHSFKRLLTLPVMQSGGPKFKRSVGYL